MTMDITKRKAEGRIDDLNTYINNPKEYFTEVYYQKSVEKGRETVKGAFMSVSKKHKPEVSDSFDDTIYYTNSVIDPSLHHIPYDNTSLIKGVFVLFVLLFVVFAACDFHSFSARLAKDNEIKRQKLLEEYEVNHCSAVTLNDGPKLNSVCLELKKQIESNSVFLHVVVIEYIKSIFSHSFSGLSFVNTVLFLVATLFLVKVVTR